MGDKGKKKDIPRMGYAYRITIPTPKRMSCFEVEDDFYAGGWKEGWKKKKPPTRISRKWLYLLVAGKGFESITFGL